MKKKLLSPTELKEFRLQQEKQRELRAAELKKKKRLTAPKELLDPKPVQEVKEEPVVEVVKEPIEILQERVEKFSSQYNEELAQLEILVANKVGVDEYNLEPLHEKIRELRGQISELPEVKYYDDDLEKLVERVDELQTSGSEIFQQHGESLREVKKIVIQMLDDLDALAKRKIPEEFDPSNIHNDIAATKENFYERVAEIKKEISELPEVKYYDEDLTELQERIESVRESIPEVPEIKYYDDDLADLLTLIAEVRSNIPEMPEVRYYENEIETLEEAIKDVESRIPTVPEVRYYEDDIEALKEDLKEGLKDVEDKIPEMPEIPEIKYYDDDIDVLSEDITKVSDNVNAIKLALRAVEKRTEQVESRKIPAPFDSTGIRIDIDKAFREIEKLKENPVTVKEDADPLTPLEDKFVTFDELSKHYRLFINRVQQQLASLGGGGEVNLRYLDDIDRASIGNGRVLSYDATSNKFKFISPGAASSLWNETVEGNLYKNANVGINSEDPQVALDVVGDVNVVGVVTATSFTGEFVADKDKTLQYYTSGISSGSLFRVTTSVGTKTFEYNNVGALTTIIGTGVYVSKELSYDGNGNLISVDIL